MTLYDKINELAKANSWSIKAVERLAGLSEGSIGKWRKHSPSLTNVQKVARVFKMSVSELIGET